MGNAHFQHLLLQISISAMYVKIEWQRFSSENQTFHAKG